MPGSFFEPRCQGCGTTHKITTGAGFCSEHHQPWGYEQLVCQACQRVVSQPSGCHYEPEPCARCGGELSPWPGCVWHERTPEGHVGAERLEGPCPRCGTTITERGSELAGLWD